MHRYNGSVDSIVQHALAIADSVDRARYVLESCGGDSELHRLVESRLCGACASDVLLDETTLGHRRAADVEGVPAVGTQVGPYLLLEEIGEGGMGIVFLAQQTQPIVRRVALKVIKLGMDTRRVVSRFETERQTMSLMEHPGITKVLDAGATETGRPYFVMELVQGRPITEYCDLQRLSIRRRLEIFIQVCNAIEHAHQKGVIHRDIKPTNILVSENDGQPLPKIIDFGIAKATSPNAGSSQTNVTQFGEMVGTPLYMSPEQANEDDVDTRSDIYSLGVVLYELVTGTTPFHNLKNSGVRQIREAIGASDPPTASQRISSLGETISEVCAKRETDVNALRRSVRGELDWILTKCLQRERSQRYQSAGELAREVKRFLNGEALDIAAPTFWYRGKKFVAQHRGAFAASAAVLLLLGFVSIFSSWMAVRASALAQRATDAEHLANSRLADVARERDRARAAERRLAQLERQQRNLVAIHEAAAQFNAENLKVLLAKSNERDADGLPPGVKLISLASMIDSEWNPLAGREASDDIPQPPGPPEIGIPRLDFNSQPSLDMCPLGEAASACGEVMLVVPDGQEDCQEGVLKSILQQQRAAFGTEDVVVAATLQQLGKVMSEQENWQASSEYLSEALAILEKEAAMHPEWIEFRDRVANYMEGNGNIRQALTDLKSAAQTLQSDEFQDSVRSVLNKIGEKVQSESSKED